ncbi:hypothetical protein PSHT_08058 [Puccinia striiformis]|uniref:Uncharacterized protein n=1 Tax=Puccinia striiformis TaxID=27350 RepID=A0A2S4VSN5_9BASI|nr:hypothetical protein PSHT_08058 [Puccinia striiformis]
MSGRQPPSGYLNATSKMAESLAEQDISDPTVLKTYFLQAITNATENSNHSNPYYVAAHHIHSLMDLRAPLTAVSIVDEGADSRFLILSIEWLPCFLAGWVFLWGLGSGIFEAAYESGLPMVIHKASAWGFNFVAVMLPIFMTISQMFNFIMAHNNMVDAINRHLPKLIPIKNIIPHEIKLANYLLSGQMMWIAWAVVLFVLTIPLVTLHLKTLKDTIRKIASECEIDLDQSALTIFEHQAAEDEPFSGPNLSSASAKQQKSTDL